MSTAVTTMHVLDRAAVTDKALHMLTRAAVVDVHMRAQAGCMSKAACGEKGGAGGRRRDAAVCAARQAANRLLESGDAGVRRVVAAGCAPGDAKATPG